jgi:hypothetical protein
MFTKEKNKRWMETFTLIKMMKSKCKGIRNYAIMGQGTKQATRTKIKNKNQKNKK